MIGIYKITSPSGKVYIGQSIDIDKRKNNYKNLNCKDQPKIYNSLNKYGWLNHKFEVIEECNIEFLNEQEVNWKKYYLEYFKNNWKMVLFCELYDTGGGPRSQETKNKISKTNMGHHRNLGCKRTEETKLILSNIAKTQEWRKSVGIKQKGIPKHSDKHINNMYKRIKDNNTGKIYNSCSEACNDLKISPALISHSLKKKYKHSKWDFTYE